MTTLSINSQIKTQFDVVLRRRHLDDVASRFSDPNYFDEVPLYSRYRQVEFLKQFGDVNLLLMDLALDYLDRVTAESHICRGERLIAITLIHDDEHDYIVPSIFVCNSSVKTRLKNLRLLFPSGRFGLRIKSLVKSVRGDAFSVYEDRDSVAGDVRVFVSYKEPSYGFIGLETFANDGNGQE